MVARGGGVCGRVEYEGMAHLQQALASGRGVILLIGIFVQSRSAVVCLGAGEF